MGEGKREGAPKGRPVVKVESVQALGRAMEGRANSAAYVENTLPEDKRELIGRAVSDKKFQQRLYLGYENSKLEKAKPESLEERFRELHEYVQKTYRKGTKKYAEMEETLLIIKAEIDSLILAFPKYKLSAFSVRYNKPGVLSYISNPKREFHRDGGLEIDDYGASPTYTAPDEESLRVVRTFVGPTTEYYKDNDRYREEVITPADGSTTVHPVPSLVWHRVPVPKPNQVRFALVLEFEPV